jgi:hypothetical protein
MKRDMDLVRQILLTIEANEKQIDSKFSQEEISGHAAILKDGGFINAAIARGPQNQPTGCVLQSLTWEGHEFLDAMRDDTLWKKAKEKFIKPGAAFTAKALFEYLKIEVTRHITGTSG